MISIDEVIETLGLVPLDVEGGMYKNAYDAEQLVDGRPICSVIYYLLSKDSFSHLHRLSTDEVYYFFLGDPVDLVELMPDGSHRVVTLGQNITQGECVQTVVKAGTWQGSRLKKQDGPYGFALLGTSMAPAYDPDSYEHGQAKDLCQQYPDAKEWIECLTGEAVFR